MPTGQYIYIIFFSYLIYSYLSADFERFNRLTKKRLLDDYFLRQNCRETAICKGSRCFPCFQAAYKSRVFSLFLWSLVPLLLRRLPLVFLKKRLCFAIKNDAVLACQMTRRRRRFLRVV